MIENPVLHKELIAKFRSRQPLRVKAAATGMVGLAVAYAYWHLFAAMLRDESSTSAKGWWQLGIAVHALLVWLLCPALASNAITQEKEQQTWEMLIFTRLTAAEIIGGKFVSRLLPVMGILLVFAPYMLFCAARGGCTVGELVLLYVLLAIWILFLVTVSLFMSWAFRKTATAIALSYMVLFALTIGTGLIEATFSAAGHYFDSPVIWLNPVRIVAVLFDPGEHNGTAILLFSTGVYAVITAFLYWRMLHRFRVFSIE